MLPKCCQTKTREKLLALGLPESAIVEIMTVFTNYRLSLKRHTRPPGPETLKSNLSEIELLSKKLSEYLKKLSNLERQLLLRFGAGDIGQAAIFVSHLSEVCRRASGKDLHRHFKKNEPFLKLLGTEVAETLARHGFTVKIYHRNIFCHVIDILTGQSAGSKSFNLLRQIRK